MGHVWAEVSFEGVEGKRLVKALIDTGSTYSAIPYKLADELSALRTGRKEKLELADGTFKEFEVAYVDIEVLERRTIGSKVHLTDAEEPALGVLTLEELGLEVDPVSEELRPSRSWRARAPSRY